MALPYVSEVAVMGVEDIEFGQRVAAAIVLQPESRAQTVMASEFTIDRLREDLTRTLARYKMPTLMRIVEGELPKSATGKVSKKVLCPQLFPPAYLEVSTVQVWSPIKQVETRTKARL
jgi:malonyl-CoA/methylmalonyl-CoA synthetase